MTELIQNLIDGLGRGSIYALLALGIAVIFGVMHLLNFAHGELITVSGYAAYWALGRGWSWYAVVPLIILTSMIVSILIERIAFSRVRGASDFTLLLTSFGVHFVVSALFLLYVSASVKNYRRPGWVADTWAVGAIFAGANGWAVCDCGKHRLGKSARRAVQSNELSERASKSQKSRGDME